MARASAEVGHTGSPCLAVLMTFLAVLLGLSPARATEGTDVTVQLNWAHQSQFAGNYVADRQGYYDQQGLKVSFLPGDGDVDDLTRILEGGAVIGINGADSLLVAYARGASVKAVAVIFQRNPLVFVSKREFGITRPEHFIGRTIRAAPGHLPLLVSLMVQSNIGGVQYRTVNMPSTIEMFAADNADIWVGYLPGFVSALEAAGHDISILYPDEFGVHFYADTVFATEETVENRPELVEKFLRATLRGWEDAIYDPGKAAAMVKEFQPDVDVELEEAKLKATLPLIRQDQDPIGWMDRAVWQSMSRSLVGVGLLDEPVDTSELIDMRFLEAIYGRK